MKSSRKIIHIDMDAFYASVEQLDNPSLKHKAVIVGGDPTKRGVVAACSYEARRFGIHSAMPCSRAVKLCPHAIFTSPRMWRYKEMSQKIMSIFLHYTDLIEPLSLDEAFLDVTENKKNNPSAGRLAETIRKQIYQETGLTASAGVSYNKFLAKVASDLDKPNGMSVITPDQALCFLDNLAIGDFFGVGRVTEKKMVNLGIRYGRHLREFAKEDLIYHFGKSGAFLFNIVRGIDERPVKPSRERKSIGSETTLQIDTKDLEEIRAILIRLAKKIEHTMKSKECCGSTVTLKVRYFDFTTITRSTTLKNPVFTQAEILKHIFKLIRLTDIGSKKVRLLGISLSKLCSSRTKKPVQLPLPFI